MTVAWSVTIGAKCSRLLRTDSDHDRGRCSEAFCASVELPRHSGRQTQTVVDGAVMSSWIFRSATDPAKPMNDAWFRDRVWRPLLEKAEVRHVACTTPATPMPR